MSDTTQIIEPQVPVTTPEPAAQTQTPAAPTDTIRKGLMASILKLKTAEPAKTEEKKPDPTPVPEQKPTDKQAETSATEPKAEKKVTVRKKAPAPDIAKEIARGVSEGLKQAQPAQQAPKVELPPQKVEDDTSLTESEREELALAEFAAKKDPSKKDLPSKFRAFYKAHNEYLARKTAADPDYDPSSDSDYKAFLAKNEPSLTRVERQRLLRDMTVEEARSTARKEVEEQVVQPKLREVDRQLRQIQETPKIQAELRTIEDSLRAEALPEDVKAYFGEVKDLEKVRQAFPREMRHVDLVVNNTRAVANDFLQMRRGLVDFDPVNNAGHKFIRAFIDDKGQQMLKAPAEYQTNQRGERFVHPFEFTGAAGTWTFDDAFVVDLLKLEASREISAGVQHLRSDFDAEQKARELRAAQKSPPKPDTQVKVSPTSPGSAPMPGHAQPAPATRSSLSAILGIGQAANRS